jgi:hypothetical protein
VERSAHASHLWATSRLIQFAQSDRGGPWISKLSLLQNNSDIPEEISYSRITDFFRQLSIMYRSETVRLASMSDQRLRPEMADVIADRPLAND